MDLNYFKKTRILDGGMGQELLSRGMDPEGTLWSAKALIEEKYHSLIKKIHEDFIKAGAELPFLTKALLGLSNNILIIIFIISL